MKNRIKLFHEPLLRNLDNLNVAINALLGKEGISFIYKVKNEKFYSTFIIHFADNSKREFSVKNI